MTHKTCSSIASVLGFGVILSSVGQGIGQAQEPLPFLEFTLSRQSDGKLIAHQSTAEVYLGSGVLRILVQLNPLGREVPT